MSLSNNDMDMLIVEFNLAERSFKTIPLSQLDLNETNSDLVYWIHCNLQHQKNMQILFDKLALPENVQRLCYEKEPVFTLIDTDEAVTIQAQCLQNISQPFDISFHRLLIHLTSRFCFTVSKEPVSVLSDFLDYCQQALRHAKTPCFILFLLCDFIINDYAKTLFHFELETENVDLQVRESFQESYQNVTVLKQQVMRIKRHLISLRETLVRLSGKKISVISDRCRTSLSNLSNHNHMLVHEADSIREMLNSLQEQIDSTLMQKLNESMRLLTAFAAIFLPLTLIAGIYGMNFTWIPELHWKYGYFVALILMIACALSLLFYFKRKKWF